jgi:hypothetical protein
MEKFGPPKCRRTFIGLHGVTTLVGVLFIVAAVKTSNLTSLIKFQIGITSPKLDF